MEPTENIFNQEKLNVLLEWYKLYSEALIDTLKPSGNVLEVGFGMGFAANRIQSYHPKTHTIIESNSEIWAEAQKWVDNNSKATLIQGKWEDALPKLGKFDAIFFNDYPLDYDMAIINILFPEDVLKTSNQVKELMSGLEETMSQLSMEFSDGDIEEFYQETGQFNQNELPRFFQNLKDRGNITKDQYARALKKYHIKEFKEKVVNRTDISQEPKQGDTMLPFLQACLKKHMNKGSRFSCFFYSQSSKLEDSQFVENVIENPVVEFKEYFIPIKIKDKVCNSLVILVEKAV